MDRFSIHHIGARFGSSPFPVPDAFGDGIDLTLYDADQDCVDGLLQSGDGARPGQRIVAACLSDQEGEAEFRLTINPSASSLLEPSEASRGFVQPMLGLDWDVEQCASVVERRRVTTCRLDTLLAERPDLPAPDFLSIDTQGSELQILRGAQEAIAGGVVGLIVEVEFIELYKNVCRFGDIAGFLESLGFHFAEFSHMINAQTSRQPIGRRSDGFPVAGDALFLRRVDSIAGAGRERVLHKLAFASIVFGHCDHAFAALDAAGPMTADSSVSGWRGFLQQLQAAAAQTPKIYLPQFPDILPRAAIQRFSREPDIAQWPDMMNLSAWRRGLEAKGVDIDSTLSDFNATADTPIEHVLRSGGFGALADRVNFCRRDQGYKLQLFLKANAEAKKPL